MASKRAPPQESTGPRLARFSFQQERNFDQRTPDPTRRHSQPGPALSSPQPRAALGCLSDPFTQPTQRIRARGPGTVAGGCEAVSLFRQRRPPGVRGSTASTGPQRTPACLLPELARPCRRSGTRDSESPGHIAPSRGPRLYSSCASPPALSPIRLLQRCVYIGPHLG